MMPERLSSFPGPRWWRTFVPLLLAVGVCVLVGVGVRQLVLAHQLELLARQSRQHGEFYTRTLESLISRNESLPKIIAMEAQLKTLLQQPESAENRQAANHYLLKVRERTDINTCFLLDDAGLTLASSNFQLASSFIGHNYAYRPYFQEAMQGRIGRFYGVGATTGEAGFFQTAPIEHEGERLGVVVVKISLDNFESALVQNGDPVLLVDANGVIFLSSVPEWRYRFLMPMAPGALQQIGLSHQYDHRFLQPLGFDLRLQEKPDTLRIALPGMAAQDYLVQSIPTQTLGWSIVLLSHTGTDRQNALLSGIAAGLTLAFVFSMIVYYRLNQRRYAERRQAEAAMREAHRQLEQRITERTADLSATNISLEEKIEALKVTETILRETRDGAVQAGKLAVLGQMAAGISHEINQPLTAMQTFTDNAVDLLKRGQLDGVRENLDIIGQMIVRMGQIVGKIKNFARKPEITRRAVCLAEVIDQSRMLVETRRKKLGVRLEVEAIPTDWQVLAEAQQLEQVFVNLLLNAFDAVETSEDRAVRLSVINDEKHLRIVVADSGDGLTEEVLAHLFEPFYTTKSSGQGLGLGLVISRMIAAELGGRLEAANHPGGGAEFTVTLEKA